MIELRPFATLGRFDNDWLSARYHFSFAGYDDPARRGVGPLLVWNDDTIAPGRGFERHGHRDMEIVTFVRRGAITHEDDLGNRGRIEAGDVRVMSAGTGIRHAEHNQGCESTTLFQIWLRPQSLGLTPRWEQRHFPAAARRDRLVPVASGRAEHAGALRIHQDAALLAAALSQGAVATHVLGRGRRAYLVPASGTVTVNGTAAAARDGVLVTDVETIRIAAAAECEVLLADLP